MVLDASMVAAWLLKEVAAPNPTLVIDRLRIDRALVPRLRWFEIRNVLLQAERRNRLGGARIDAMIAALRTLPIEFDSIAEDMPIFDVAKRQRLTFYDACYLELALRRGLPLATLDKELIVAAGKEGVSLVWIGP